MKAHELNTPVYLVDEEKLIHNLTILKDLQDRAGCKVLLAQKAFSMYSVYPLIAKYLTGATASGLYEARLAYEEMGLENHVFEPAFGEDEMEELCKICDHIVFNSINQLEKHRPIWQSSNISVGLRVNPECSTQEDHEIYDPCSKGSRLGIRRCNMPDHLPEGVEGIHMHTLCEQGAEPLLLTVKALEDQFSDLLYEAKWLNLGGGHHITREGYNIELLCQIIDHLKTTYDLEIYLEPGEAIALDAGYLYTKVMDIVDSELPVLILDTSAACHMPDVLEMPYRPPLRDGDEAGKKRYTYRLSSRTCLAGDVIGDYSFDEEIHIGDTLIFEDMAIYSMVKNNTFNGMPLPSIALMHVGGDCQIIKEFGYEDFKCRLS